MDVDATLLGTGSSLTPGNFRGPGRFPLPVSFSFTPLIILPCIDYVLVCSDRPAWKRLISDPLSADERISLITTIFSDHDMTKVVEYLSGDDAQTFINVIDEVSLGPQRKRNMPADCQSNARLGRSGVG